jgi:hypothetical protein
MDRKVAEWRPENLRVGMLSEGIGRRRLHAVYDNEKDAVCGALWTDSWDTAEPWSEVRPTERCGRCDRIVKSRIERGQLWRAHETTWMGSVCDGYYFVDLDGGAGRPTYRVERAMTTGDITELNKGRRGSGLPPVRLEPGEYFSGFDTEADLAEVSLAVFNALSSSGDSLVLIRSADPELVSGPEGNRYPDSRPTDLSPGVSAVVRRSRGQWEFVGLDE